MLTSNVLEIYLKSGMLLQVKSDIKKRNASSSLFARGITSNDNDSIRGIELRDSLVNASMMMGVVTTMTKNNDAVDANFADYESRIDRVFKSLAAHNVDDDEEVGLGREFVEQKDHQQRQFMLMAAAVSARIAAEVANLKSSVIVHIAALQDQNIALAKEIKTMHRRLNEMGARGGVGGEDEEESASSSENQSNFHNSAFLAPSSASTFSSFFASSSSSSSSGAVDVDGFGVQLDFQPQQVDNPLATAAAH